MSLTSANLVLSRDHFQRLLDNCIEYTGQDGQNDGLAPGAFCRYCSEELSLDQSEEGIEQEHHRPDCEVYRLKNRIAVIDAALDGAV